MWDIIQKLAYRSKVSIPKTAAELEERLRDRRELPLAGIHGERLYLTGVTKLEWLAAQLQTMYEQLPDLMEQWFRFREWEQSLVGFFIAHFYFVYVHPFCDGNDRTARIVSASSLYHAGWKKMKSLPLSNAINNELNGYYRSLEDSETQLSDRTGKWLDLSPFVSYMLDVFEQCMIDAALPKRTDAQ